MNFASSIYSKLEPRIEDEIGRTTTTEGRSFFVSETRPIIRDVLFSRGKTRALYQVGGERRDTPSSKETKIVLRPGYKLQISLPSPANARLLVYPACRGCLRFFLPLLHSPFNSGSPVPSRPSNSRAWPTTKHPPFANGNCRKFHRILPRLASSIEPPLIRKSGAINVYSSSLSHRSSTRRERIRSLLQEKTL